MACADGEASRVVGDVVDAVGSNRARGERGEVMVEGLRGPIEPSRTFKVPHHHLLCVYADDGNPVFCAGIFCLGYLFKLGVSDPHFVQWQALKKEPFLESCVSDHLPYEIIGDFEPSTNELAANLRNAKGVL